MKRRSQESASSRQHIGKRRARRVARKARLEQVWAAKSLGNFQQWVRTGVTFPAVSFFVLWPFGITAAFATRYVLRKWDLDELPTFGRDERKRPSVHKDVFADEGREADRQPWHRRVFRRRHQQERPTGNRAEKKSKRERRSTPLAPLQQLLVDKLAAELQSRQAHVLSRRELDELVIRTRTALEQDPDVTDMVRAVRAKNLALRDNNFYLAEALRKAGLATRATRLVEITPSPRATSKVALTAVQEVFAHDVSVALDERFGLMAIDPETSTIVPTDVDARLARTVYEQDLVRLVDDLKRTALDRLDVLVRPIVDAELSALHARKLVEYALANRGWSLVPRHARQLRKTDIPMTRPTIFEDPSEALAYNSAVALARQLNLHDVGSVHEGVSTSILDQIVSDERAKMLADLAPHDRAAFESLLNEKSAPQHVTAALDVAGVVAQPSKPVFLDPMGR